MGRATTETVIPYWLIAASVLAIAAAASADGISVSQSLSTSTLAFEDSAVFEIVVQWTGPQSAYRFDKPLSPYFDRLVARGVSSSISASGTGPEEVTTKKFTFTLVPTSSGRGSIDPITIPYVAMPDSIPGELVTEAMSIQIAEPLRIPQESTGVPAWLIVVLIVGGTAGGALVVLRVRRRRGKREPVKSPVEKALEALEGLKKQAGGDKKAFQSGLYRILVDLAGESYAVEADGLEEEELSEALAATRMGAGNGKKLAAWIVEARKDKFRPVTASPGDTVRLESEVREFLSHLR